MHFFELQYETNNYMNREQWTLARDNLKELLKCYYESYDLKRDQQSKEDIFFTLLKIGKTYHKEENFRKCILYYLRARKFYIKNDLNLEYGLSRIHNRLYSIFMDIGKESCANYFIEFEKFHGKYILLDKEFTKTIKRFWKQNIWEDGPLPFLVDRHGKCLEERKRRIINKTVSFLTKKYGNDESYIFNCLKYINKQAEIALGKRKYESAEGLRGLFLRYVSESNECYELLNSKSANWVSDFNARMLGWGEISFLKFLLDAIKKYDQKIISNNSSLFWDNIAIFVDNSIKGKNKKSSCYLIKLIKDNIEYALSYDFEKCSIFNMYGCIFYHTYMENIPPSSINKKYDRNFFLYYGNKLSGKCCYWEDDVQKYKNYWRIAKNWRELNNEEEYNLIIDKIKDIDIFSYSLRQKRQIRNYIFDMLKRTTDESLSEDIKSILIPLREDISGYISIINKDHAPSSDLEKINHVMYCISCKSLFVVKDSSARHCPECGSNDITFFDTDSLNKYLKIQAKMNSFFGSDYQEDDIEEIDFVYKR